MTKRLQSKLSGIVQPAVVALCFRLQNQVVILLNGTADSAAERDLLAGEILCRRMINVKTCDGKRLSSSPLIDFRLQSERVVSPFIVKVLCNKLIGAAIFLYDGALPCEEIRYEFSLKLLIFGAQRAVDGTAHIGKVFPRVDTVAPIIQSEGVIQCIQIVIKFLFHVVNKFLLCVFAAGVVGFRFIVKLEADDMLVGRDFFHQATDDDLGMF